MEQLTAIQLAEWEVFCEVEPLSSQKSDIHWAYLLSTVTNLFISVYGKQGSKKVKTEDYLINWWEDKQGKVQTAEDMKDLLMSLANQQNRKVKGNTLKRDKK